MSSPIGLKKSQVRALKDLAVILNMMAFAMPTINLLIYWVGLHLAPGNVVYFIYRCVEIKRTLIGYTRIVYVSIGILDSFGIYGTNVPFTTGHLPIAINAVIFYDNHNLSKERRSLPGSGITLMTCES